MMDEEKFGPKRDKEKTKFVVRTPMEAQRVKLEKLMSDPSKPVIIPTAKQKKDFANAIPSFIRNVMGSSAGAGSGEFHVYRHLRRKEYARQKHIQQKSKRETLDDEFYQKMENNRLQSDEKTAKKRAKRLKKKQNAKNKAKMPKIDHSVAKAESGESDEEDDDDGEDGVNEKQSNIDEAGKDTNDDEADKATNDDEATDGVIEKNGELKNDAETEPKSEQTNDAPDTKDADNQKDSEKE